MLEELSMSLSPSPVPLLLASEAATRLRLSEARVYELIRLGILPGVRMGRQVRLDPQKLDEFVQNGGAALDPRTRHPSGV